LLLLLLLLHSLQAENRARDEALAIFKEQLLGRRQAESLQAQLDAAISKEAKAKRTANLAESNVVCQAHEMTCAKLLAGMAGGLQIPSMRQFEGRYKTCLATFEVSFMQDVIRGWILCLLARFCTRWMLVCWPLLSLAG
jgi:hypothetical protein